MRHDLADGVARAAVGEVSRRRSSIPAWLDTDTPGTSPSENPLRVARRGFGGSQLDAAGVALRMRGLEPPQSYLHTDLNRIRVV
jgi:hypothetical protein